MADLGEFEYKFLEGTSNIPYIFLKAAEVVEGRDILGMEIAI